MTCQWCLEFRRKGGRPVCAKPGRDGNTMPSSGGPSTMCEDFRPRMICTTCEYRCSPDEKSFLVTSKSKCSKWKLRELSTWGGSRYRGARISTSVDGVQSAGKQENEKETT